MPRSVLASAALLSHRQHLKTTSCKLALGLGLLKKRKVMVAQGKDAAGGYGQSITCLPSASVVGAGGYPGNRSLHWLPSQPHGCSVPLPSEARSTSHGSMPCENLGILQEGRLAVSLGLIQAMREIAISTGVISSAGNTSSSWLDHGTPSRDQDSFCTWLLFIYSTR